MMFVVTFNQPLIVNGIERFQIAAEATGNGHYWANEANLHIHPSIVRSAEVVH